MMRKRLFGCIAVLLISASIAVIVPQLVPPREETTGLYPAMTEKEMIRGAELIVKGRFISCGAPYILTFGNGGDEGAAEYEYTRAQFQITEVITGEAGDDSIIEIRLESAVGNVKQEAVSAENQASAGYATEIPINGNITLSTENSDELLLILNRQAEGDYTKEEGNYYVPFRNEAGIYSLTNGVWRNEGNQFLFKESELKSTIQSHLNAEIK